MADEKNWWQPLSDFADLLSQPLFPNPANAFAPAPEPAPVHGQPDRR